MPIYLLKTKYLITSTCQYLLVWFLSKNIWLNRSRGSMSIILGKWYYLVTLKAAATKYSSEFFKIIFFSVALIVLCIFEKPSFLSAYLHFVIENHSENLSQDFRILAPLFANENILSLSVSQTSFIVIFFANSIHHDWWMIDLLNPSMIWYVSFSDTQWYHIWWGICYFSFPHTIPWGERKKNMKR